MLGAKSVALVLCVVFAAYLLASDKDHALPLSPDPIACELHGMLCKGKIHSDALLSRSSACGR